MIKIKDFRKSSWLQVGLYSMILFAHSQIVSAASWQVIPEKSSISFTATQNNAPVKGEFKKFNADIQFDPAHLETSKVSITIDTNSVNMSYQELAEALKMPDWFDVKIFPHAVFKSTSFVRKGENAYQANGELTIRDKTQPATVEFKVENSSPTQLYTKGETTLKRSLFGIGQGEWADTNEIKDDVKVNFILDLKQ